MTKELVPVLFSPDIGGGWSSNWFGNQACLPFMIFHRPSIEAILGNSIPTLPASRGRTISLILEMYPEYIKEIYNEDSEFFCEIPNNVLGFIHRFLFEFKENFPSEDPPVFDLQECVEGYPLSVAQIPKGSEFIIREEEGGREVIYRKEDIDWIVA